MDPIKTILLTGATGYLGSKLAGAFIAAGYNLVVLKRHSSNLHRLANIENQYQSYDIENNGCQVAFQENKIDCVVHAAASYGRKGETFSDVYKANLLFPVELVDNCLKYNVKYFLNTGTTLPEDLNAYALSKAQFAALLKQQQNISTINIQLQYFYGPGDDNTKFITFILNKILSGASSIDLSAGTQYRDFIYIDDVVSAYLLLLKTFETQLQSFLDVPLGLGKAYALKDIVENIRQLAQSDIKLNFGAVPMRAGEVMYAKADIQLLNNLGWQPVFDIQEGLTKTINIEKSLMA